MTDNHSPEPQIETPAISSDFFHGDIRRGLEVMRLRLLDLTSRNRLLNFKHTKKSSLRVVDELPDQILEALLDNRELHFSAVRRPRQPWSSATSNSQQLRLEEEVDASEEGKPQFPPAKEEAERLGIRTPYELPLPSDVDPTDTRYSDRALQTLHYPEELESILRTIGSAARLAVEETGTNMLYLVAGFLEWFESPDSNQPRLAPLVLIPVTLQRGDADATNTYRYSIQQSGDDVVTNISLQERCRRDFAFELPDLHEDECLEAYFQRLQALLVFDTRWQIRRNLTLTLLSFGKLLMYRDLDSDTWPKGAGPAEHPRIKDFFEGVQRNDTNTAAEYSLDKLSDERRLPPVVDEADSSQHSALVDALEGRNIVIEGPPGTGKSQTITNLIAAALADGKRVLFVSEKLAALEVVRHRLDGLGLGMFCLELHSHKTQKRKFLDEINSRINLRGSFRDVSSLDAKLEIVAKDRGALTAYVDLINTPFGKLYQTLYDVIWSARRQREMLRFDGSLVDQVQVARAAEITPQQAADLRSAASAFSTHLGDVVIVAGSLREHPWFGLGNTSLTFVDEASIVAKLSESHLAARELRNMIDRHCAYLGVSWIPARPDKLEEVLTSVKQLPAHVEDIFFGLLPRLRERALQTRLTRFVQAVRDHGDISTRLLSIVSTIPDLALPAVHVASKYLGEVKSTAPGVRQVSELTAVSAAATEAASSLRRANEAVQHIATVLVITPRMVVEDLQLCEKALKVIAGAPWQALPYRRETLDDEAAVEQIALAKRDAEQLRRARNSLAERFDLSLVPDLDRLRDIVVTCANAKWWSFLSSDFRAATRAFRSISRSAQKPTREAMTSAWRAVHEYVIQLKEFDGNSRYRAVAGPHYQGIDSPWEHLQSLCEWRNVGRVELAGFGPTGNDAATAIWAADTEQLRQLQNAGPDMMLTYYAAQESLSAAIALLSPSMSKESLNKNGIEQTAAELVAKSASIAAASEMLDNLNIPAELQIEDTDNFIRLLLELDGARSIVRSDPTVVDALGEGFVGAATNLDKIARTVTLFESFRAARIPESLRNWLLSTQVKERLHYVFAAQEELATILTLHRRAWSEFASAANVDPTKWLQVADVEAAPMHSVVDRAERALAAKQTLPGWLDYIGARDALAAVELQSLVKLAEENRLESSDILPAVQYIVANSLVQQAFRQHPSLARFSGLTHEQIRSRFALTDRETMVLQRQRAAHQIDQRRVPVGNGVGPVSTHSELELVEREIGKQRRHIPLRQLLMRGGRAIQALKPCFMMGPLSVAQYLAPGALSFDIVVMDEASQLKPEDALGAIARAAQVVIVGDRMQLPPTSFFDRIGEDDDDNGESGDLANSLTESESILDVASAIYKPRRRLRWHYRSRHGSLIAFSNKEFYDNELIVFPSPIAKSPSLGVKFVNVRDGVYADRRNVVEARRVVDTALRHMLERPTESLGVVTLNSTQRELVEGLFEQRVKHDRVAMRFIEERAGGLEPFFIKNLENVQGDERDVIYISITYGRSSDGHVFQRFGPINSATGHRRLNVLFTRARCRTVVFSSMLAEDIIATPASAWGVRALKGYLHYAQTGILDQASFSGRAPDSDFEIEVAEALRTRGYEVVAQVGVAGYFIDLAVKHPHTADSFILAIECDGRTYHSGVTARDRDRLRQSILVGLGWKVLRIWSTDWFKAKTREVERIVRRLEEILNDERAARESAPPLSPETADGEVNSDDATAVQLEDEDNDWKGEAAAQPLSVEEAQVLLVQLRKEIDLEFPTTDAGAGLLRDEMMKVLLRTKPRSRDDFLRRISVELRLATDGGQVQRYLPQVIAITSHLG